LEERGVRNHVIDPASLQVNRRARGAKTDRIDAERLLRSLMAYLRGEPKGENSPPSLDPDSRVAQ
jgi:transposase